MSTTHEHGRASGQGWTHGLAMLLGCLASVALLLLVFALGLPKWLIFAALLVCPAVLAFIAAVSRGPRDAGGARPSS